MKCAMAFPHYVYLLRYSKGLYVGITSSLSRRLKEHKEDKEGVEFLDTFMVPTRREALGVEAFYHQLQKQNLPVEDFFCIEYFNLHSLWFHRGHKGYPKYLESTPQLKF